MFSVGVSDHCMVAHSFADPFFGPAQALHGATYTVEVEIRSPALGNHHVVMDLSSLKAIVRKAVATIHYTNLDDHPAFPNRSSTSERIAEYLSDLIADGINELPADGRPSEPASLHLRLRETPNAWAVYERPLHLAG